MNKKLLSVVCSALFLSTFNLATAQDYQTMPLQSGFNADVIANGVGTATSSTNNDVDGVSFAFLSRDFQLTATSAALTYGLPTNGTINTAVGSTPGLTFQMGSYSGNNSMRLATPNLSATATFATPKKASTLYMIATGGSGATTVDVSVNFGDGTSQAFTGIAIADWYGGANFAIQGIGRVSLLTNVLESGNGTNPRLYQISLAITAANQPKDIQSVTVTKTGTGGIPNIFAFSADVYNPCESPLNIISTPLTTSATVNWTAPANAPAAGYEYFVSTVATAPTTGSTPTGSVGAGITSFSLNNLTIGQTYYVWIRSNCGASKGAWKPTQFTTGQISVTYNGGDIQTMYSNSPTPASSTSCSGTLSIVIPAGFKIKSTDVFYKMSTVSNGWMAEQRSVLSCLTNNQSEASVSAGAGSSTGTYTYNRTGLLFANNLTGTVDFGLKAWRTYGGTDCNADFNKVDDGTWKVTVTLESTALATNEIKTEKENLVYPNPFNEVLNIIKSENVKNITVTDLSGKIVRSVEKPNSTVNLQELGSGLYIITLKMKDGSVKNTKIIKK